MTDSSPSFPQDGQIEFLTIEQVAERLHVSRATLFTWKQSARLVHGRHYLQRGRVLRFVWSAELALLLFSGSDQTGSMSHLRRPAAKVSNLAKGRAVNWDY